MNNQGEQAFGYRTPHCLTGNGKESHASLLYRVLQVDFRWELSLVGDMCEPWGTELQQGVTDMDYYDEQTWKKLDPKLVEKGEREELERLKKMGRVRLCLQG